MVVKNTKIEKGFRKLFVWQRAHEWVLLIYKLTEKFPKHEIFGLTSKMRRAAVSVAANMAEGYASGGTGQFGRYLDIAQGSLAEVEYYLILAFDLKYITQAEYDQAETGYLLHRLIKSLGR